MASNKKPRKPYSKQIMGQRLFQRTRVWFWESADNVAHAEARKNLGMWCELDATLTGAILWHRNHWRIAARALLQYPSGEVDLVYTDHVLEDVRIRDPDDFYLPLRTALLEDVQAAHIVDVGWIMQTIPHKEVHQPPAPDWIHTYQGIADPLRKAAWREARTTNGVLTK